MARSRSETGIVITSIFQSMMCLLIFVFFGRTPLALVSVPRGQDRFSSRTQGCSFGATILRPTGTHCGRLDGEHLSGTGLAGHVGRDHKQYIAVLAAEHAGEAAAVELDRLQHLTTFAHA